MRNIFLKNNSQDVVKKLFPDPFLKNQNWAYLLIKSLKFDVVCFYCVTIKGYRNMLKLRADHFTLKAFSKKWKSSGISLPASFSAWLMKKNVSLPVFYQLTKFYCLGAFTSWDIMQYVYCNCLRPGCDVINFKINLVFLIKTFFLLNQKVKTRILTSWERKELLKRNKKHFSSFLKGFYWIN